jgi:nucleotide-binding universal stress UspA family protein
VVEGGRMKILLAVDGSQFSDAAAQALISETRTQDSEVLVLEVVEPLIFTAPPQSAPGYAPELAVRQEDLLKAAQTTVTKAAEILRQAGFKKVETRTVEAETKTGILAIAEDWKADLIVLGSHGRRGLKRFFLGSVAEGVARHANCSVLIVRAAA